MTKDNWWPSLIHATVPALQYSTSSNSALVVNVTLLGKHVFLMKTAVQRCFQRKHPTRGQRIHWVYRVADIKTSPRYVRLAMFA